MANAEAGELDWIKWSPSDVAKWVDDLLGIQIGVQFRENQVDGPTLLELRDEDLRGLLGVQSALHRHKILLHTMIFRAGYDSILERERIAARGREQETQPAEHVRCGDHSLALAVDASTLHGSEFSSAKVSGKLARSLRDPCSASSQSSQDSFQVQEDRLRLSRSSLNSTSARGLINSSSQDLHIGLDSPSYSRKGSWGTAPRKFEYDRPVPGPCSYPDQPILTPASPRHAFGRTARDTCEHMVKPGVASSVHRSGFRPASRVQGGTIGTASRWQGAGRPTPGPATYRPRKGYLSTFK